MAAGGVQALAAVLDSPEAMPLELRLALSALDGLTRGAGACGCEAVLGWWAPAMPEQDAADGEGGAQSLLGTGEQNGVDAGLAIKAEVGVWVAPTYQAAGWCTGRGLL